MSGEWAFLETRRPTYAPEARDGGRAEVARSSDGGGPTRSMRVTTVGGRQRRLGGTLNPIDAPRFDALGVLANVQTARARRVGVVEGATRAVARPLRSGLAMMRKAA